MASKVSVLWAGESDEMDVQVRRATAFQGEIDVGFFSKSNLSYGLLSDRLRQWSSWSYQESIALAQHEESDAYTCGRSIFFVLMHSVEAQRIFIALLYKDLKHVARMLLGGMRQPLYAQCYTTPMRTILKPLGAGDRRHLSLATTQRVFFGFLYHLQDSPGLAVRRAASTCMGAPWCAV